MCDDVRVFDETGTARICSASDNVVNVLTEELDHTGVWKPIDKQSRLKTWLRGLLPDTAYLYLRRLRSRIILVRSFLFDYYRFSEGSSAIFRGDTKGKLAGLLTISYHNIEKGLSLSQPRVLFGRRNIRRVVNNLDKYVDAFGWDELAEAAYQVLIAYSRFNESHAARDAELEGFLEDLRSKRPPEDHSTKGGVRSISRDQFLEKARIDLQEFFKARSSIRNFSPEPVAREEIFRAVAMAQKTPSVCNRQTGRVMLFDDPQDIRTLLSLHGGARGFSEAVPMLLAVSSDLSRFQSAAERYQGWIEGGMFSCSLVYALHSLGLGTCCLNWSRPPEDDRRLLELVPELKGQLIAMFIAVGHLPDRLNVPISASPPIGDVISIGSCRRVTDGGRS